MENKNQWIKELSTNGDLWTENLDKVPSMIKASYDQLRMLAKNGQVYGVMLQLKDVFETLYRIPIIMALIIIDSCAEYKEGAAYTDILKEFLCAPMSMGQWDALGSMIIKKNDNLHMPEAIIGILKRTRKLYYTEVTSDVANVINWRNEAIGHGALKFEDDESYKREVESLIILLKNYFDGNKKNPSINEKYAGVYFLSDNQKLIGDTLTIPDAGCNILLCVESEIFQVGNYADANNLKYYLFNSFYCKKRITKYSSYIDGKSEYVKSKYFEDLYEKIVLRGEKNFNIQSKHIKRGDDMILECLSAPNTYIKPLYIIQELKNTMEKCEHGIIAMFMERGTGKSAFAHQMSGLYNKNPLIRNSFSRSYHIQNASLRGIADFYNSINNNFRHSFDHTQDLWGSTDEMPVLTSESSSPAEDMAAFLNYYHELYGKEYTILIIDGIDEITRDTSEILDCLPSSNQLDNGVFIILLSRFKDEETVLGTSKKYIEFAENFSIEKISVKRKDEENIKILTEFINQRISVGDYPYNIECGELIVRADYRFLFLKACLEIKPEIVLDSKDEYSFICSYFNYVLSFYGPSKKQMIKEIAVTIALFPSMSIRKYQEYINCMEITYEFIGSLNVLLPVMTVLHVDGEEVYAFADEAYSDFALDEFSDVAEEVIKLFYVSMANKLEKYLNGDRRKLSGLRKVIMERENDGTIDSIIFFSEGLSGMWNKACDNEKIRNAFFENTDGARLLGQMELDQWTKSGYGYYIQEELSTCFGSAVYYCVQNTQDQIAYTWIKKIIEENKSLITGIKYGYHSFFSQIIADAKHIEKIYSYVTEHQDSLIIEDWFWVLCRKITDGTIASLRSKPYLMNKFVDYLFEFGFFDIDGWINKLSETELTHEQEAHLLNRKLFYYTEGITRNEGVVTENYSMKYMWAKECLESLSVKGYALDPDLFSAEAIEKLKKLQSVSDYTTSDVLTDTIRKATEVLLNSDVDLMSYESNSIIIYKSLIYKSFFLAEKNRSEEMLDCIKELFSAAYKRMCFDEYSVLKNH